MKKILVLTLVVLVAGAAFAATDPVFSGSFSLVWGNSFSDGKGFLEDLGNSAKVDLKATIDDFNKVGVKMSLGKVVTWDDANNNKTIEIGELDTNGKFLKLDNFTLKTDVTGAMGLDLPVSITTTLGKFKLSGPSVADVAPYSMKVNGNAKTGEFVGLGLDIGIMDLVTIGTAMFPSSFWDEIDRNAETGIWIKSTGLIDMIDVAVYFIASEWDYTPNAKGDPKDPKGHNLGLSVGAAPMDGLKLGLGFNYDLYKATKKSDDGDKKGVASMKLDAAYSGVEGLNVGFTYKTGDFTEFVDTSAIALAGEYQIFDFLSVYGGMKFKFKEKGWDAATGMGYDVGVSTALGALKLQLGASDSMDYKAPKDNYDDVVYVKVSASF